MKGILALDIDGTVVDEQRQMSSAVCRRLGVLSNMGWQIAFITGRTFSYGYQVLRACEFPYQYACYNGALTFRMPERNVVRRHLLAAAHLVRIEEACRQEETRPFVHLSVEQGDTCYWQPMHLDAVTQKYAAQRQKITGERWKAVESVTEIPHATCAYAKSFGSWEALDRIRTRLLAGGLFAMEIIGDPLRPSHGVILITDQHATKGGALADLKCASPGVPSIAAGNDYNDITLLQEADIGIAMAGAPSALLAVASLHAPPASEDGILVGLEEAMARLQ